MRLSNYSGLSRSVHFNNMSPEKQRIFPDRKNRDTIIEERSERCDLRRTQPAIDGFQDRGRAPEPKNIEPLASGNSHQLINSKKSHLGPSNPRRRISPTIQTNGKHKAPENNAGCQYLNFRLVRPVLDSCLPEQCESNFVFF